MRILYLTVSASLFSAASASAQTGDWRFHWEQGQVLNYQVEQTINVTDTTADSKIETKSKVNLVKRWEVLAVDDRGVATMRMSITSMRNEQARSNGDVQLYDSSDPDQSTPELRDQLSKLIGKTIVELCVDGQGRVVDVKQGAGRYEVEPPFVLTMPVLPLNAGQSWLRDYAIAIEPPVGTGQKYAAQQKYFCSKIEGSLAIFTVNTMLPTLPENKSEQLPLLQKMTEGEVVFDLRNGRLQSARLTVDRQILGHKGEGSSFRFQSTYSEQFDD